MTLRELIWPVLEPLNAATVAQEAAQTRQDLEAIQGAAVTEDAELLVEEARRLSDAEEDRRKTAETRANTYLAAAGVLMPVLAVFTPAAVGADKDFVRTLVTLALFIAAGAYLFWSGRWAFRCLEVGVSARLDAVDLIAAWAKPDRKAELVRGLLKCVRLNRKLVNFKIDCVKMAHAFAVRAFAIFVLAGVTRFAWEPVAALLKAILT